MLIYNTEKKLFEYDNDHKESYVAKYLKQRNSKNINKEKLGKAFYKFCDTEFNETQLFIILEALTTKMEAILKGYEDFLGDAVMVFNKIKESLIIENNEVIKNGNKAAIMVKYLGEIGSFKSHPSLQIISIEALSIYNYYKGNFWSASEDLNLKAFQLSPVLSNLQEIEAYNIVGEHLEEAINTIQKSHIYALAESEDRLHYTPPDPENMPNDNKENSFVALVTKEKADNNNISTSLRVNKRALSPDEQDIGQPNKKLASYMPGK